MHVVSPDALDVAQHPSLSFARSSIIQDVSNQAGENADGKNGQPNVTKRGASSAAIQPQRSVTLESQRGDNDGAVNFPPGGASGTAEGNGSDDPALLAPQAPAEARWDPTSYQYSAPPDDIDERDSDDPLCATSYVQDMYEHFRTKEAGTSVRPVFMEDQPYINERMRSILVDWLVEVHLKFKLVPETLYLTINLIDRYLSKTEVSRPKLQLVGVTALLIASKYEEIYPPELRDLVYICDRAYSKLEVSSVFGREWGGILPKSRPYCTSTPFLIHFVFALFQNRSSTWRRSSLRSSSTKSPSRARTPSS